MRRPLTLLILLVVMTAGTVACGTARAAPALVINQVSATFPATWTPEPPGTPAPTRTPRPTYTPVVVVPTPAPLYPVPNQPVPLPTPVGDWYLARSGETLQRIAARYEVPLETLSAMNRFETDEPLEAGDRVAVPSGITVTLPPHYLVHDSEIVYGRAYLGWNTTLFVEAWGGYLSRYREGGRSGTEIIDAVATEYRIGPRPLLALLEMHSGWLTGAAPRSPYAFGLEEPRRRTLDAQSRWAAARLAAAYYQQLEGRQDWVVLRNRVSARLAPGTNPGSAAIAAVLAATLDEEQFVAVLTGGGFQATYERLYGQLEGGPVLPPLAEQPPLALPWRNGESWYLTGGPHGGYGDEMSGWAALDFAPPNPSGCAASPYPVLAVAPGRVLASARGETWIDMDGDGDIRTGWVIFYMHLGSRGRVVAGEQVEIGDVVGYPSCEGGRASGAHVHLARLYDGQWMPAEGPVPFRLGSWTAQAVIGNSYSGRLVHDDGRIVRSCNCRDDSRNRIPPR